MPHLAFDLSATPPADAKLRFSAAVVQHFSRVMDTGTDHIAVSLRCLSREDLAFGRSDPSLGTAFLNADLRRGRTADQKRRFALAVISELERTLGIPPQRLRRLHRARRSRLPDARRSPPSWSAGEDPLKDMR